MIQFATMCEVHFAHKYFSQSMPSLFSIVPTPVCRNLLRRSRSDYKLINNQLLLYTESTETKNGQTPDVQQQASSTFFQSTSELNFEFALYSALPNLSLISDLPKGKTRNDIIYFSNRQPGYIQDNKLFPYNAEQWHDLSYWTSLQAMNFGGSLPYSETLSSADTLSSNSLSAQSKWQFTSIPKQVPQVQLQISGNRFYVDARGCPPGLYGLYHNQELEQRFYLDDNLVGKAPVAMLSLVAGSSVALDTSFIDMTSGIIDQKNFNVQMVARKAVWRYVIIPKYTTVEQLGTLTIKCPYADFSKPETVQSPTGHQSWRFTAQKTFGFTLAAKTEISLQSSIQGTLIANLPGATTTQLIYEQQQAYADIFVYV